MFRFIFLSQNLTETAILFIFPHKAFEWVSHSVCVFFMLRVYHRIIKGKQNADTKGCDDMKKMFGTLDTMMLAAVLAMTLNGCTEIPEMNLTDSAVQNTVTETAASENAVCVLDYPAVDAPL